MPRSAASPGLGRLHPGPGRSLLHSRAPARRLPLPRLPPHSWRGIPRHCQPPGTPELPPRVTCPPGTPELPPRVTSPPGTPELPPRVTCPPGTPELPPRVTSPPGSPEAAPEYPAAPSPPREPPAKASRPPGSPEGPDDSPVSPQSPEGPDLSPPPPPRDSGLRRPSEGLSQPPPAGQGVGELGGSLGALPRPGDPLSEPALGSGAGWSLSQSFQWTFPSRGARRPASPPRSPTREAADSGLSEESDGGDAAPSPPRSRGDSGSEGAGPTAATGRGAERAPCPGGPVAQREAEGSAEEEEEGEGERDGAVPRSPLCGTEPGRDPAEPEPPARPGLPLEAAPGHLSQPDPATVGDRAVSLQGPGGPGRAEGPSRDPDPHGDPGWLTELLASPGAHGSPDAEGPEDLLGWSRKDLSCEFGIAGPRRACAFAWTHEAAPGERDWPGETERERESNWDSSARDGDQQDGPFGTAGTGWGSDCNGTELLGKAGPGCSEWGESCRRDQGFGAGEPEWGTGYGLGSAGSQEEAGPGQADWSSSRGVGHGPQQDGEPSARQPGWARGYGSGDRGTRDGVVPPAWAGGYGTGDTEMKDRGLTPDWAGEYSSSGAGTEDKDLTLGWAGRSSTGDTGTPEQEFGPSRAAWDSTYSPRDMERQDREFSPSRPAWDGEHRTGDMESQDREFSPGRLAWTGEYGPGETESQDREFSPSRAAWDDGYSTGDVESRGTESQDREFSPGRLAWDDGYSSRGTENPDREFSPSSLAWPSEYSSRETQDSAFSPSGAAWDDGYSTGDVESQERECSPGGAAEAGGDGESRDGELGPGGAAWPSEYGSGNGAGEETEFVPGRLSWAGELVPGPRAPDTPERGWGSGATDSGDWAGAERRSPFGVIGTERAPDPSVTGASPDGSMAWAGAGTCGGPREPRAGWHRDLSVGSSDGTGRLGTGDAGGAGLNQTAWGEGPGSLPAPGGSAQPRDAEARRREWASAFGARCAARSRDVGDGEQSPGGDAGSADGSTRVPEPSLSEPPSPPEEERDPLEPPSPTKEERDPPEPPSPTKEERDPPEAAGGTLPGTESEAAPVEQPEGQRPPGGEEERLSLGAPQPEGPPDPATQDFTFLEDTEVLDSSVYRSKASLGRKRRHRAPALRPGATADGDGWFFRDSTEPRPDPPAASSDEEAAEEPRSRRVRASPSGRGVKVPIFPGLSASALKAKLRGRNRSVEEGAAPGDGKGAPAKDPHVQRSKSCKIAGGKPLALPPKPEKASGSEASPPHWLQALKLKKKKP
ncbi:182 kDa tankyrase-1-binding protein [Nyctibius grandis]|uniref:182 kDa tankyrase-1-binding protein n=1 Tax=Nyctibius grandis TaxID=48427 RepID=UPI0035BBA700